jgi:thymidylate synthase (FAD)
MQTIEPYANILNVPDRDAGIAMLKRIEYYARVSHRSEESMTETSYERLLRSVVLQHGDLSVIEHEAVNVEAVVDRGITHEWVRHRIGSYTQESTRFVNYQKGHAALFVVPPGLSDRARTADNGEPYELSTMQLWRHSIDTAESIYRQLVDRGVKPQIARSVFPNALASKIIVTFNLRTWRHFFIMRTSAEAHPQMKEVSVPLLRQFQERIPILFEDIIPEQRQAEAMRLLR